MVVRLDLAEDVDGLLVGGVFAGRGVDVKTASDGAGDDGGVVLVGGEDAFAVEVVGVLDHLEQRLVLLLSVDVPGGVENLVAAVLGVGLREHHELDIVGVAFEAGEGVDEVVDFVVGEGEAEGRVGLDEGGAALGEDGDAGHRARLLVAEEGVAGVEVGEDDLRHAVVELGAEDGVFVGVEDGGAEIDSVGDDAFDALDINEAADVGDVGGFGGPRGNGAGAGGDNLREAGDGDGAAPRTVGEEFFEDLAMGGGEVVGQLRDVDELGGNGARGQTGGDEVVEQFVKTETGEGGGAAEDQHGQKNGFHLNRARDGLAIGKTR